MTTQAIFIFGLFVTALLAGGLVLSILEVLRLERKIGRAHV